MTFGIFAFFRVVRGPNSGEKARGGRCYADASRPIPGAVPTGAGGSGGVICLRRILIRTLGLVIECVAGSAFPVPIIA